MNGIRGALTGASQAWASPCSALLPQLRMHKTAFSTRHSAMAASSRMPGLPVRPKPTLSPLTGGIVTIVPDAARHFTAHRAALQSDVSLVVAVSFPNSGIDNTAHFAVVRILSDCDTPFTGSFEAAPP